MSIKLDRLKKEYCENLRYLADVVREEEFPDVERCLLHGPAIQAYFDMEALRHRVEDAILELATFKTASIGKQNQLVIEREELDDLFAKIRAVLRIHRETEGDTNARGDRLSTLLKNDCGERLSSVRSSVGEPTPERCQRVPRSSWVAWEKAIAEAAIKPAVRKRLEIWLKRERGEKVAVLQSEYPGRNIHRDRRMAAGKDVPALKQMYSDLPDLEGDKSVA